MNQTKYIGEQIRKFRKQKDLSAAALGELLNPKKSESTVTSWERGRTEPDGKTLLQLCSILGVDIPDFYYERPTISNEGFTEVPLYGRIAAGTPIEMDAVEDYYPVPTPVVNKYKDVFLLRVEGESMNKVLPNGCLALVERCDECEMDGKPYAVCVNGYDATIKRVRRLNNGFELVPDSTDPTYQTHVYNYNEPGTEEITIIGRVVYHMLPFDWEY